MRFYNPDYFWLYWLIPAFAAILLIIGRFRLRKIRGIGNPATMRRIIRTGNHLYSNIGMILSAVGFIFIVGALSRPQYPGGVEKIETTGGEVVIALDVSLSMLAEDFQPNRLEKAKREIVDLLDRLKAQSMGLVVFAGEAFVQCPPTVDYSAFRMFLDVADVGIISDTGTDLADAISKSVKLLDDGAAVDKAIIVFTDGETFDGDAPDAAAEAAKLGIKVYAIGVGSSNGRPIPTIDGSGNLKKDSEGEIVLSKLNSEELTEIAEKGGGEFYRATPGEAEIDKIYADIKGLEGTEQEKKYRTLYDEKYRWLLLPGIIFICAAMLIPTGRENGD